MPRRGKVERREIPPDPLYGDKVVAKLINKVMKDGKKGKAEKIVYKAFEVMREKLNEDPLRVFRQAVENVKPILEVRPRRVGGQTYQVPVEVRPERRLSLALKWIVEGARERSGKSMIEKLSAEIMDAYRNTGAAVKRKEDMHRMAEANKAFAHYRW